MDSLSGLVPGSLFANDFEIVRPLSSGGMGSVYVALQKSTGKQRALKLMLTQLVANAELRKRFHQEARIASLIKSEHVVEVVGAGVDAQSGAPWLAMELLDGMDLDTTIAKRGPMTLAETRSLLEELCHAVSAAHDAGIIHRDLKPENIFLARSNRARTQQTQQQQQQEVSIVKVLDFGIAKVVAEASTKHTGAMGSPIWMAPEQTERGVVTPAADVWALGLIAFFMLVGKPFWLSAGDVDGSVQQIMREVLFDPIPTASERAQRFGAAHLLPPWFDEWFARCVVRDPEIRLQRAGEAFALFAELEGSKALTNIHPSSSKVVVVLPPSGTQPSMQESGKGSTGPTVYDTKKSASGGAAAAAAAAAAAGIVTMPIVDETTNRRNVRPAFLFAAGFTLILLVVAIFVLGIFKKDEPPPVLVRAPHTTNLPEELASTRGGTWFTSVRARCNPVEVDLLMNQAPPPHGKDGAGFAAACYVLAGKLDHARSAINAIPNKADRTWAAWPVFEVVHPIADAGDDASAGPAMRLVLDYWPENYMAVYHAGMSEYRTNHPVVAREHLQRFLQMYNKADGFKDSAEKVLADLDRDRSVPPDCKTPLVIDPEGRRLFRVGCKQLR